MSEEFTKVATQEILEDISKLDNLLTLCKNDTDVIHMVNDFQTHFHKIKGLAPMMGKEYVGEVASIFDSLMKQIRDGQTISGVYDGLSESLPQMRKAMGETNDNLKDLQTKLLAKFAKRKN